MPRRNRRIPSPELTNYTKLAAELSGRSERRVLRPKRAPRRTSLDEARALLGL